MAMRQIPVVGGFYDDPNKHWSRQDVLNWLPVPAERPGTKTAFRLKNAPGMRPLVDVGGEGRIRGMRNVEGKLFVVQGNQLYQINSKLVALPLGTIPGVGRVSMAHNAKGLGNELLIVNGSAGYVYDTNTNALAKVTDEGYPGAIVVDFVDQYFAQVEPQGRYWFHSDLADGHSYNTLDRYQAEADPDRITGILTLQPEVLVFGRDTTEVYVNAGGATGTFQRASNTIIQAGCSARFSPRRMDNTAFWLDDKRLVRRLDGYTPVIVSTEAINAAFWECSEAEISQAYAFTWESGSHKVYYITVPGRFTFGYDAWSQEWHRRDTPGYPHWAVTDVAFWNGEWIAADALSGTLYVLDWAYPRYGCDELVRSRTTGKLFADGNRITLNEVQLLLNTGNDNVACVHAQQQPDGPSISGSAPDGKITLDYGPFQYTIAPGDAPISTVKITSGSLPAGLSLSNAGEITGRPTEAGTFSFTITVTDANGLEASHSDSIDVTYLFIAVGESGDQAHASVLVPDYDDWGDTLVPLGTSYFAAEAPGKLFVWDAGYLFKSEGASQSWVKADGWIGGSGGPRFGVYKDGMLFIGGFIGGYWKTFDDGDAFTNVASPMVGWPAWVGDRLIVLMQGSSDIYYSESEIDDFQAGTESWTKGGTHSVIFTAGGAVASFNGVCIFGGTNGANPPYPAIGVTTNGASAYTKVIGDANNSFITSICGAMIDGKEVFIATTSAGQIIRTEDRFQNYTFAAFDSGLPLWGSNFDGRRFIVVGGNLGSAGSVAGYSEDGHVFTEVQTPFGRGIRHLLRVLPDE